MQANKSLFLFIFLLFSITGLSQSYGTSFGLRLGNNPDSRSVGLSTQHRIARFVTMEGIIQSTLQHDNFMAHLLIERHKRIISRRLNFYAGVGFSLGNEASVTVDPATNQEIRTHGNPTIGTDFILGVETTILSYNVSVDYKPNINFEGREPWYISQVGISIRQVLVKSGAKKKRKRKRERAKRKKVRERDRKDDDPWLRDWYERTFKKG